MFTFIYIYIYQLKAVIGVFLLNVSNDAFGWMEKAKFPPGQIL